MPHRRITFKQLKVYELFQSEFPDIVQDILNNWVIRGFNIGFIDDGNNLIISYRELIRLNKECEWKILPELKAINDAEYIIFKHTNQ